MAWKFFTSTGAEKRVQTTMGMVLLDDLTVTGSVLASYDTNSRLGGVLPTTYKHLKLIVTARLDGLGDYHYLRFNNDSGNNYNTGQALASSAARADNYIGATNKIFGGINPGTSDPAGAFSISEILIPNYNGSTQKIAQAATSGSQQTAKYSGTTWGEWAATVITRISLTPGAGNYVVGTRFTLYGVS